MAEVVEPLVFSVSIDATPAQVFPFFTDPARLVQWLGHSAELDPVAEGRFAVDIGHRMVRGRYLEVVEPSVGTRSAGQAPQIRCTCVPRSVARRH